jgi:hypothetical protein
MVYATEEEAYKAESYQETFEENPVYWVGRYDNGSGFPEFGGTPTLSRDKAIAQVADYRMGATDVVPVYHDGVAWQTLDPSLNNRIS